MSGLAVPPANLRTLPKIELHRHLEGTMRAETVAVLAAKNGVPVPDPETFYRYDDLPGFLKAFGVVCSTLVDADDYFRVAYESTEDASEAGVVYAEVFFTPHEHLHRGVSFDTLWNGLTEGLRAGEIDFGVRTRLIMDVDKASGAGPALEQVEMCRGRGEYLVGVGGDGVEEGVDNTVLKPAFGLAASLGLHRTLHAGEFSPQSVAEAVRDLGCERVDHGPLTVYDPALARECADRGIAFTVCPTSDVVISKVFPKVSDHTLAAMINAGLLVTLNSDDPAMLGLDVADEYETVLTEGLTDLAGLREIAFNGIEACWLPDADKAALRSRFAGWRLEDQ
jgi:adenosine deaminase